MDNTNPFAQFLRQPQQQSPQMGQQQALIDALRQEPQQQQAAPMAGATAPIGNQLPAQMSGMAQIGSNAVSGLAKYAQAHADPLSDARQAIAARDGIMGIPTQGG